MMSKKTEQATWRIRDVIALCACTLLISLSTCVDGAMIRVTNMMETPASAVSIECQSTTRATDWGAKEISSNETFSLSFRPSLILFNTEVWCKALRVSDGANAHFRLYWQNEDWPFAPLIDWELHSDELWRRPSQGVLLPLFMRVGRFLARFMGLWSFMTF